MLEVLNGMKMFCIVYRTDHFGLMWIVWIKKTTDASIMLVEGNISCTNVSKSFIFKVHLQLPKLF